MQKPFIYPFQYIGKYYFFDVNRNQIIEVPKQTYYAILNIDKYNDFNLDVQTTIKNLKHEGYLSSNRPLEIENPLDKYKEDYLCGNLKGMILQLTQNCNLKCRYCIFAGETNLSRSHNPKNMTWDIAKKSIDFFKENSKFSDEVEIGLYGGEPFLSFDLIKRCVTYINEMLFDKTIHYKVTTNGTVMNKEILDFLKNNNIELTISIDGPEDIHNTSRRFAIDGSGSYNTIVKNLLYIKEKEPHYFEKNIQFNSVVANQENWNQILAFFQSNEIFSQNSVQLSNVSDNYLKESYQDTDAKRINSERIKFELLMSAILNRKPQYYGKISDEAVRLKKLFSPMEPLPSKIHHLGPCMPGYRRLFIDIYGKFRVCEKASEKSPHMIIGDLENGFIFETISDLLNIGKLTESDCLECPLIRSCKICAVSIDSVDKLSIEKKKRLCKFNKDKFLSDIKDYIIYKEVGII